MKTFILTTALIIGTMYVMKHGTQEVSAVRNVLLEVTVSHPGKAGNSGEVLAGIIPPIKFPPPPPDPIKGKRYPEERA